MRSAMNSLTAMDCIACARISDRDLDIGRKLRSHMVQGGPECCRRAFTSGKDRLPAREQRPHVWDVLIRYCGVERDRENTESGRSC
jgi:hypothetical protein